MPDRRQGDRRQGDRRESTPVNISFKTLSIVVGVVLVVAIIVTIFITSSISKKKFLSEYYGDTYSVEDPDYEYIDEGYTPADDENISEDDASAEQ